MNPTAPTPHDARGPTVVVVADADTVAREGERRVRAAAARAFAARDCFRLALAGGSTPQALYARLAVDPGTDRMDWTRVQLFFGDERCVPPDHPDSNFGMVKRALLDHIQIPSANVHRWRGEETRPSVAATEYARELEPQRPLDLALLGLGGDGHTASLFPHTSAIQETTDTCVAVDVPALGATRLTLTVPVFVETRELLFLVTGTEKAEILHEAVAGAWRPLDLPSQTLLRRAGPVTVLCDRAAAALLPSALRAATD